MYQLTNFDRLLYLFSFAGHDKIETKYGYITRSITHEEEAKTCMKRK